MRLKPNVCMDMVKSFNTPRNKDLPLNFHIICTIIAYYYYEEDILNLAKPKPLIDILSHNTIYVSYPDICKMKNKKFDKIRRNGNE